MSWSARTRPQALSLRPRGRRARRTTGRAGSPVSAQYPGLPIETVVSDLAATRDLSILSLDADLLVTDPRSLGTVAEILQGSVSRHLAAHAYCPLAILPHGQQLVGQRRPELVLAVGPDTTPETIDFGFATSAGTGLRVRAIRAFGPLATDPGHEPWHLNEARENAIFSVESQIWVARAVYPHVPVTVEAYHGQTMLALCDAAHGARILVVGCRRERGILAVNPGRIVQRLLSHSETPVALVPAR